MSSSLLRRSDQLVAKTVGIEVRPTWQNPRSVVDKAHNRRQCISSLETQFPHQENGANNMPMVPIQKLVNSLMHHFTTAVQKFANCS